MGVKWFGTQIKMLQLKLLKNNNWLRYNDYSIEEERKIYEYQLKDILENTRWYLDSCDFLCEYRVSWIRYSNKKRVRKKKSL